ncbi:MAG: sulfatase [Prolixibacteraceae bacterium]
MLLFKHKYVFVIICCLFISGHKPVISEKPAFDLSKINFSFKPNILWLTCEDINPIIGCYGDPVVQTPNIDQLAAEGVRFTNVYSVSGVCAPSRCAIITGMYPTSIGGLHMRNQYMGKTALELGLPEGGYSIVPPAEVKCFSEYLRANGYFCTNNVKTDYQFKPPLSAWNECSKSAHYNHRKPGQPFFAVFKTLTTHESRIISRRFDTPLFYDPDSVPVPPYHPDLPEVRSDYARKYTQITKMDGEIGFFLNELEKNGLLDSTIIFFFSDHGGMLPREKREIYDSGIHVPFMVRFPKKLFAGAKVDELVSFVDIAPTMLSLVGIDIPEYLQGQPFMGKQKQKTPREYIFAARDRMGTDYDMFRAVRSKKFKYIKNYHPEKPHFYNEPYRNQIPMAQALNQARNNEELKQQFSFLSDIKAPEELYDTTVDPYEINNLADDPKYTEVLAELRSELDAWQKKYGDLGFLEEPELLKKMWEGDTQPLTENITAKFENGWVHLNCDTKGSSIVYQVIPADESTEKYTGSAGELSSGRPECKFWKLYTHPVKVNRGVKLVAVAERIGYEASGLFVFTEK